MLQGVEILLARAKEFPEEFAPSNGRWERLLKRVWDELTDDEKMILTNAITEARRTWFNGAILEELANPTKNYLGEAQTKIIASKEIADQAQKVLEESYRSYALNSFTAKL